MYSVKIQTNTLSADGTDLKLKKMFLNFIECRNK